MPPVGSPYGSSTTSSPGSRAATIGRILDALGIDPPAPEGQAMKRQADDLSEDWVARFRADTERLQSI